MGGRSRATTLSKKGDRSILNFGKGRRSNLNAKQLSKLDEDQRKQAQTNCLCSLCMINNQAKGD